MTLNPANDAFADSLRAQLPPEVFRPLEPRYLEEPRGTFKGQDGLLLAPGSTEQVAAIVRACNAARVGIVPYGGGTGLVGGQVMEKGPRPVILSLERMTAIRDVSPADNVLVAEAGAILADIQAAAAAADRLFPLSLASEGSCRIGGNLSTNAGGVGVLRYGNARDLCLGLEAVLPDGTIWHGLSRLRKDNTGYDLRHLLIGAEGTLGILTAASLKLFPRPTSHGTAFLGVTDPQAALDLLGLAQGRAGGQISAFELIARTGFDFLAEKIPQLRRPFSDPPEWMVLIDIGTHGAGTADGILTPILEDGVERGWITDALIAQSAAQRDAFWTVRETIPEANRLVGAINSHDISVPVARLPDFIAAANARVAAIGPLRINCFGHLGDGNLHFNVYPPKGDPAPAWRHLKAEVKDAVYGLVHDFGGSVSAEHGIGRAKVGDLVTYGDPAKIAAMQAIKAALDPTGIMNPGAVIP
jgi:FAD/FMN-containing dehydrogenase